MPAMPDQARARAAEPFRPGVVSHGEVASDAQAPVGEGTALSGLQGRRRLSVGDRCRPRRATSWGAGAVLG